MKFVATSKHVRSAFKVLREAVPARTVRPILSNVRAQVSPGGSCLLHATDLELQACVFLTARDLQPGSALLPAKWSSDVVKATPTEYVTAFLPDGEHSRVSVAGAVAVADNPELFPSIAEMTGDILLFEVDSGDLLQVIERVEFAAAREETRYAINGIRLRQTATGDLEANATDGRRLSIASCPMRQHTSKFPDGSGMVLPIRVVLALKRHLPSGKKRTPVMIRFGAWSSVAGAYYTSVSFSWVSEFGTVELTSRLLESRFPDVDGVVPALATGTTKVLVDAAELIAAVEQAAVASAPELRMVAIGVGEFGLIVSAQTSTAKASAPCAAEVLGRDCSVNLNPDYLIEALDTLPKGAKVWIRLASEDGPKKARVAADPCALPVRFDLGAKDGSWLVVQMPISGS